MVNTMQHTPATLQARPSDQIAAILDGAAPLLAEHPGDPALALFVLGAAGEAMVSGVRLPDVVRLWLLAAPSNLFQRALDMARTEAKGLAYHLARRDTDAALSAERRAAELLAPIPALAWRSVKLPLDVPLATAVDRLYTELLPWGVVLAPPPAAPGSEPDVERIDAWLRKGVGDAEMRQYAAEHPEFAEILRAMVAGAVEDHAEDPTTFPLWPGVVANPV